MLLHLPGSLGADRVEGCLFGNGERTGNVCRGRSKKGLGIRHGRKELGCMGVVVTRGL